MPTRHEIGRPGGNRAADENIAAGEAAGGFSRSTLPVEAALDYAAHGLPVFPCTPRAKTPVTAHGFKDATRDPQLIRAWWTLHPRANVAIATGAGSVDVLDVDVRPSGSGWAAFNQAKRAGLLDGPVRTVQTPSGGLHVWYPGTEQACSTLRGKHVDWKARGGYVLVPPSYVVTPDYAGSYVELGRYTPGKPLDWSAVRRLLDPSREYTRPAWDGRVGPIDRITRWLGRHGPGDCRNNALFNAACWALREGHDDLDELQRTGEAIGLLPHKVAATIRSARRTVRGEAA